MATSPPLRTATAPGRVLRLRDGRWTERGDRLAGEEPLEIRVQEPGADTARVAVTMRTPGHDFALAVGLLVTEGLVLPGDVVRATYCTRGSGEDQHYNVVRVSTSAPLRTAIPPRAHAITAACGVCGLTSLEQVRDRCAPVTDPVAVPADVLLGLTATLAAAQEGFARTGALHAAGLFTADGTALCVREDVGRHNAVDKVVGWAAMEARLPLTGTVLLVSGRVSFEIVQKAAVAGIPVLAAVSGPSSLAVRAAEALGVTTIGFLREDRMNLYSHPERITRSV